MNNQPPSPFWTVRESADYLRCSVNEIYRRLAEKQIRRFVDGGRILILRSEIEASVKEAAEPPRRRGRPIKHREPVILVS